MTRRLKRRAEAGVDTFSARAVATVFVSAECSAFLFGSPSRHHSGRTRIMRPLIIFLAASFATVLCPASGAAQELQQPWQPVAPDGLPEDFDWIRLPSDEWLKGEVVSMYDDQLEFESDELGDLKFDFADIKELRSSRVVQVGFEDGEPAIGQLIIDGDTARVVGDAGEVKFERARILSIIAGTPRERNYWSGYANVGGNIRSGNTDQIDYTARLGTMRRTVKNRTSFDYVGNITRIDSEDTSNNHRANVDWDRFVSKRLFVTLVKAEWYRDPFQNVANRWTVGAGLGYEIVDTPRTSWSATAGPAWQSTAWDSVEPGDDDTSSSVAFQIGTDFGYEISDSIDYYAGYEAYFTGRESGSYTHHFDTGLVIDLIGDLDFNLSWIWDHIQEPRPLEDGSLPKKDDTRLVFGLGWSF
jgi:putative salt-induced outer membrane protein YdiY